MNDLERTLIEKAGYAHGWENVRESTPGLIVSWIRSFGQLGVVLR
jgi:hypothetical protein